MAIKKKVTQNAEEKGQKVQVTKTKLVKMAKDGKSADVHPLEVDNYRSGGFQVVQ